MLKYLLELMMTRPDGVPVWVTLGPEHAAVERIMVAVDEVGMVLTHSPGGPAEAYPWHTVYRLSRI